MPNTEISDQKECKVHEFGSLFIDYDSKELDLIRKQFKISNNVYKNFHTGQGVRTFYLLEFREDNSLATVMEEYKKLNFWRPDLAETFSFFGKFSEPLNTKEDIVSPCGQFIQPVSFVVGHLQVCCKTKNGICFRTITQDFDTYPYRLYLAVNKL